jgi:hypothetical protein
VRRMPTIFGHINKQRGSQLQSTPRTPSTIHRTAETARTAPISLTESAARRFGNDRKLSRGVVQRFTTCQRDSALARRPRPPLAGGGRSRCPRSDAHGGSQSAIAAAVDSDWRRRNSDGTSSGEDRHSAAREVVCRPQRGIRAASAVPTPGKSGLVADRDWCRDCKLLSCVDRRTCGSTTECMAAGRPSQHRSSAVGRDCARRRRTAGSRRLP